MLLENRNAVVYGGAGAVGSVVAKAFARAGAQGVPRRADRGNLDGGGRVDPRGRRDGRNGLVDALDETGGGFALPTGSPQMPAAWTSRST